jgi:Ca2+-binding RTX toxin-like protein
MALVTINRTSGNDVFRAYESNIGDDLILNGLAGNDTLAGGNGHDQIFGGAGNDSIAAHGDGDALHGEAGNDTLSDNRDDTEMYGGTGNDTYVLNISENAITKELYTFGTINENANEGTDSVRLTAMSGMTYTLQAHVENVSMDSVWYIRTVFVDGLFVPIIYKDGTNGAWLSGSFNGVTLNGNAVANILSGSDGTDTLNGMLGDDTLKGGRDSDALYGGDGNDSLDGGTQGDVLRGNAGNDTLSGGSGNDTMYGGTGNDTYKVDSILDLIVEAAASGIDTVLTTLNTAGILANIENIGFIGTGNFAAVGNDVANVMTAGAGNDAMAGKLGADRLLGLGGNDSLAGEGGADTLEGGEGADTLDGGSEADRVDGGAGNDLLLGGTGADTLLGGEGNDTLRGGAGADSLVGGNGADRFVFTAATDSTGSAYDRIVGFVKGVDRLDLSAVDADATAAGKQGLGFSAEEPFFLSAGDLWIEETLAGTVVRAEINGDTAPDIMILVAGVAGLTAGDFILA